jgi:hypothetical protein
LSALDLIALAHDNVGKKNMSYNDKIRTADDITSLASAGFSLAGLPEVGAVLTVGEKIGTAIPKIIKAEREAVAANGGKPLTFWEGGQVAEQAILPKFMTDDVKDVWKNDIKPMYDKALNWVQLWGDMSKEGKKARADYKAQKKKEREQKKKERQEQKKNKKKK